MLRMFSLSLVCIITSDLNKFDIKYLVCSLSLFLVLRLPSAVDVAREMVFISLSASSSLSITFEGGGERGVPSAAQKGRRARCSFEARAHVEWIAKKKDKDNENENENETENDNDNADDDDTENNNEHDNDNDNDNENEDENENENNSENENDNEHANSKGAHAVFVRG